MASIDIPNPIPLTQEAVPARVFDKQYCTELTLLAHPDRPWEVRFVGMNYDGTTIAHPAFSVELKDLKALAEFDKELARAMGGVLSVVGKYLVKCKIANKHTVTKDNIEEILS
jgi:hypothetical protein